MDLTILAYATLGLSLFVSAVKMGGWILHADPRTILNGGRWALVALAALALGVLLWLVMSGRWSSAMMLAAFMLPIFVQAAPRWRVLFGPLNAMRSDFPPITPDFSTPRGGFSNARDMTDPELVQQSLAVLRAYLAQAGAQAATANRAHAGEPAGRKRRGDEVGQRAACACRRRKRSTSSGSNRPRAPRRSGTHTAASSRRSIRNSAARTT